MTGVGMMNGSAATKPMAGLNWSLAADAAHQQHGGQDVEKHEWSLQNGNRRPRDPEKGRDDPRLHAEHVVLTVEEQRKRPKFAQMLGHQPDDGLVGIEVDVSLEYEDRGANEHQEHRERGEEPGLASPSVKDRSEHARSIAVTSCIRSVSFVRFSRRQNSTFGEPVSV